MFLRVIFCLYLLLLCGCSSEAEVSPKESVIEQMDLTQSEESEEVSHYEIPPFLDVEFSEDASEYKNDVWLDISHIAEGYFGVKARSDERLKVLIKKDDLKYTYNLMNDETVQFYPLSLGDGSYSIQIMENVVDTKYREKFKAVVEVSLLDEFQPYLHPSIYVNYAKDSECVRLAESFAQKAADANDLIRLVYEYVCANVTYDREKAATVKSGYVPDPDETLSSGKGICFDYATLTASMLRSQGIPTKLIFGYVAPNDVYHAWNMVYTEENGWITVEFSVDQNSWNRVDLTFSANGSDDNFIGNGENYADASQY